MKRLSTFWLFMARLRTGSISKPSRSSITHGARVDAKQHMRITMPLDRVQLVLAYCPMLLASFAFVYIQVFLSRGRISNRQRVIGAG